MAKKIFGTGILALALVFGMTVVGCWDEYEGVPSWHEDYKPDPPKGLTITGLIYPSGDKGFFHVQLYDKNTDLSTSSAFNSYEVIGNADLANDAYFMLFENIGDNIWRGGWQGSGEWKVLLSKTNTDFYGDNLYFDYDFGMRVATVNFSNGHANVSFRSFIRVY
jgi:hypothetical protein